MIKIRDFQALIFIFLFSFSFSNFLKINEYEYLYNYLQDENETKNIDFDKFVYGNIKNNSTNNYRIKIEKDSEQIYFDYQSEFGCLYINIKKAILNTSYHNMFCSEGTNNLFILNKSDILHKINIEEDDSIAGLNIIISVGCSKIEVGKNINFNYSLKVSFRKQTINIFEINSEHKLLCKTEKVSESNFRCLFIINFNNISEINNNLIIYSNSQQNTIKSNIFADYINKDIYDNWNVDKLISNIPNLSSIYNNYNQEIDFVNISNIDFSKYIYISVETHKETTIEIISQILPFENIIKYPLENDIQIYNINKNSTNIYLDFNEPELDYICLSLTILYGKASITLGYDESIKYITDIRENKLLLMININSCNNNKDCKLIINEIEKDDETDLGFLFYISYKNKCQNILNEIEYGKSNKLLYTDFQFPIILYDKIPNINSPININLQMYNIQENYFNIQVLILSQKEIYQFKLDNNYIKNYNNTIKGKYDNILSAANIHLTTKEMESFNVNQDPWLLIYITSNINDIDKLIIGSTISQVNSLISPSERIYHYGKINNEEKIVYKLKGKAKYHLMRLEFGSNNGLIGWSVKRNNSDKNYKANDTDLSFVTEKWINGRELLTMYIENGEDIYLTIFPKEKIINTNITNYIFKYITSGKNYDFKNYYVKNDSLNYNTRINQIKVQKLKNIPSSSTINYYLKIINEDNYIKNEEINTIAIIESNYNNYIKGSQNSDFIEFHLNNTINKEKTNYINVYAIITENYLDIDYLSYSGYIYTSYSKEKKYSNIKLIIASFSISGTTLLILLVSCMIYYHRKKIRRRIYSMRLHTDIYHGDDYYDDDLLD